MYEDNSDVFHIRNDQLFRKGARLDITSHIHITKEKVILRGMLTNYIRKY
jgi:hypothetical protein